MAVCVKPFVSYCPSSDERKSATADRDSWYDAPKWALAVAMCFTAILIVVIIIQAIKHVSLSSRRVMKSGWGGPYGCFVKMAALARALHYHRFKIRSYFLPYSFPLILVTFMFTWITIWTFVTFPYYRPGMEYGSPPLGVRAGYIATALVPLVFALGSRVNPVTFLTGISHERLQVYHQYGARFILFMSIVHTIPFIVAPYQQGLEYDGSRETARYFLQYYYDQTEQFWNGIPPLVALVWIIISSMGYFRRFSYEFFVIQHVISTLFFLVWMLIHVQVSLLSAWYYCFVAVGTMIWSWFGRVLWTLWANEFKLNRATLEPLPEGITRVRIVTPVRWTPAQSVYLRFPTMKCFQSHPFTIASVPNVDVHSNTNVMQLLIRGKGGITKDIHDKAKNGVSSTYCLIDGPYGGLSNPIDNYKHVTLISGGTGINATVGILLDLVRKMEKGETLVEHIDFVWTIRSIGSMEWFNDTFKSLSTHSTFSNVNLVIHVTGSNPAETVAVEKSESRYSNEPVAYDEQLYNFAKGRPDVKDIVKESTKAAQGVDLAVVVCGPSIMNFSVMNTCAAIELKIAAGESELPRSLFAHSESFEL